MPEISVMHDIYKTCLAGFSGFLRAVPLHTMRLYGTIYFRMNEGIRLLATRALEKEAALLERHGLL